MFPTSSEYKTAVRGSHKVLTKVELLRDDTILETIYPDAGSVDVDMRRAARRTCTLTLKNHEDPQQRVSPYGNEVKVYRGITYQRRRTGKAYSDVLGDYATYAVLSTEVANYGALTAATSVWETVQEYVPLGIFLIIDVDITADEDGTTTTITGVDRSVRIARASFTEPYTIAAGVAVETALADMLFNRWSSIRTSFTATGATTTQVVLGLDSQNDPWKDAVNIAETAACDLYFDQEGTCVLAPKRDYTDATGDQTYLENEEAMLLNANRRITAEGVYNAVVVTGEGTTDATFRSVALDDDPASPTYVYGPFGLVPTFRSSSLINSQASADKYAAAALSDIKGTTEAIAWTQIVDASLDAGDTVTIVSSAAGIERTLVLDRLTVPLAAAEPMSAIARTIRTVDGESYLAADQ